MIHAVRRVLYVVLLGRKRVQLSSHSCRAVGRHLVLLGQNQLEREEDADTEGLLDDPGLLLRRCWGGVPP